MTVVAITLLIGSGILVGVVGWSNSFGGPSGVDEDTHTADTGEDLERNQSLEFREIAISSGFEYNHVSIRSNRTDVTPSGGMTVTNASVYVTDYDGNDWPDILAIGGPKPMLFRNDGGTFSATDALPEVPGIVKSALFFDFDRDGLDDLFLLRTNATPILLENEDGNYETRPSGIDASFSFPTGATSGDFDDDGCPDVFVIQNGNWGSSLPEGIIDYDVDADNGNPNRLYVGDCSGNYTLTEDTDAGIRGQRWSLAVSAADFDGDGALDIHVANDYNYDVVYLNRGNGSFEQRRLPERTNQNGMASEVADVNGDRRLDLFVTNIYLPDWAASSMNEILVYKNDGNNMLENIGNATFVDRGRTYGVRKGGWGWAAVLSDFDNDGDEDLFHTTREVEFGPFPGGDLTESDRRRLNDMPFYSRPVVRRNDNGTFRGVSAEEVGFLPNDGRAAARVDFDRDGDIDLVVSTRSGAYKLYENIDPRGTAVQLRVETESGTTALGAEVTVVADGRTHWRTVRPYTDFLSQDERLVHVGTDGARHMTVRVEWADGTTKTFKEVETDQRLVIGPGGIKRVLSFDQPDA